MRFTNSGLILTLLASILISACTSDKDSNIHPNERNIPSESEANIINLQEKKSKSADTDSEEMLISDLKKMTKIAEFGEHPNKEEVVLGRIADVVIDSSDRIYLLDSKKQQIQVFDRRGTHITSVGSEGPGPAEFERASSISIQ